MANMNSGRDTFGRDVTVAEMIQNEYKNTPLEKYSEPIKENNYDDYSDKPDKDILNFMKALSFGDNKKNSVQESTNDSSNITLKEIVSQMESKINLTFDSIKNSIQKIVPNANKNTIDRIVQQIMKDHGLE